MELLGDTGLVKSRFGLFGGGVIVGARQVHRLRQTYHRLRNHFGCTDGTPRFQGSSESSFSVCLVIVLVLTQDRCTVCAEHTIGMEIALEAPDGTSR